jgi:hypothetical protein
MAEWRNGRMAEWQSGIMYSTKWYGIKIRQVHRCLLGEAPLGLYNPNKKKYWESISPNWGLLHLFVYFIIIMLDPTERERRGNIYTR